MIGHALKKTSARNTCNYRIENKTMPWGPTFLVYNIVLSEIYAAALSELLLF